MNQSVSSPKYSLQIGCMSQWIWVSSYGCIQRMVWLGSEKNQAEKNEGIRQYNTSSMRQ